AENQARDLFPALNFSIVEQRLKSATCQVSNSGTRGGQAQQTLRRHDDQRPLESGPHLTAQQVEILSRRGRITNLQIIFRAELEVTLYARARMLRALAFVTVRQQHHQ